jgi:hypothetical protein
MKRREPLAAWSVIVAAGALSPVICVDHLDAQLATSMGPKADCEATVGGPGSSEVSSGSKCDASTVPAARV